MDKNQALSPRIAPPTAVAGIRAASIARRRLRERLIATSFVLPAVLLLVGLLVYPLCDGVWLSLQHISPYPPTGFVGLNNYSLVLHDSTFWQSVLVTAQFSICSLLLEFLIGFGLALLLVRIVHGEGILRVLLLLPTMVTPVVAGLNFRMMLNYDFGVVNYLLRVADLPIRAWTSDPSTALLSLVLTDVWRSTPFFVLVLSAALLGLSPEFLEAADIDGANAWQKLIFIKVPLIAPLIMVALLFRIIDLFRTFDTAYTLTEGGPGHTTEVVSLHIYNDMFQGFFTSYSATEATIVLILTVGISLALIRVLNPRDEP